MLRFDVYVGTENRWNLKGFALMSRLYQVSNVEIVFAQQKVKYLLESVSAL